MNSSIIMLTKTISQERCKILSIHFTIAQRLVFIHKFKHVPSLLDIPVQRSSRSIYILCLWELFQPAFHNIIFCSLPHSKLYLSCNFVFTLHKTAAPCSVSPHKFSARTLNDLESWFCDPGGKSDSFYINCLVCLNPPFVSVSRSSAKRHQLTANVEKQRN